MIGGIAGLIACALCNPVQESGLHWSTSTLKITVYDPAWCDRPGGAINGDGDCSIMADGRGWAVSDYGSVAACIDEMHFVGSNQIEVTIDGIGTFTCRDRGGAINWQYDRVCECYVTRIDLLWDLEDEWDLWSLYVPADRWSWGWSND